MHVQHVAQEMAQEGIVMPTRIIMNPCKSHLNRSKSTLTGPDSHLQVRRKSPCDSSSFSASGRLSTTPPAGALSGIRELVKELLSGVREPFKGLRSGLHLHRVAHRIALGTSPCGRGALRRAPRDRRVVWHQRAPALWPTGSGRARYRPEAKRSKGLRP